MRSLTLLLGIAGAAYLQAQAAPPTFNKEVVRIFQNNCQTCHHPGDIAPFSLMDYTSARPYARDIQQQTQLHIMPPWKPSQGADVFLGARGLSQADINTLSAWADAGAPEGNPADLPAPLSFPNGWALGTPDLVLQMPQPYAVYAAGNDIYRCFSLATNLPADTYVSAIQIRPGAPTVEHHVVLFSDPTGQSAKLDAADPLPGYSCFGDPGFNPDSSFFGAWAPGIRPVVLSPGTAMKIPKGDYIVMQVHYHPNGTDTTDQTDVGLYFTKSPVDKIVYAQVLANTSFTIPAGNSHYQVNAGFTTPLAAHLVNILPHMHLLGTESHTSLISGKTTTPLIDIMSWDFNWQGLYSYVTPVPMKVGDQIQFTKYFDNSVNNARNPNSPPRPVSWGEQTTDEMAVVFFGFTLDAEHRISPTFAANNIVNAASYAGGTAAPGAIMSLFGLGLGSNWAQASGTVPTTLASTKISVSGVSGNVPLFYASPSQVNFQMPFEASGAATLTLVREDGVSTSVSVPIAEAQPGLFSADSSGAGPAAAQRADYSTLSSANPAARGEEIVLYATGLGRVTPAALTGQGAAGQTATTNAVTVTIGGSKVTPDYAGLTPGFVGLYQVNFRIPADLSLTGDVAVKVTSASVDSNTVTVSVK
jgi:uncharacterized protein (TIGR03437 family)